jgi:magnesium chelatase subunit I
LRDSIIPQSVRVVFGEYVEEHGLDEIPEVFRQGARVEVVDLLLGRSYSERFQRVQGARVKEFEVDASSEEAVRASSAEFVLAGMHSI